MRCVDLVVALLSPSFGIAALVSQIVVALVAVLPYDFYSGSIPWSHKREQSDGRQCEKCDTWPLHGDVTSLKSDRKYSKGKINLKTRNRGGYWCVQKYHRYKGRWLMYKTPIVSMYWRPVPCGVVFFEQLAKGRSGGMRVTLNCGAPFSTKALMNFHVKFAVQSTQFWLQNSMD